MKRMDSIGTWAFRLFLGLLCCLNFPSEVAYGRWESVSQALVTFERNFTSIEVAPDGSYEKTEHLIFRINKESGISTYGFEEIHFESSIEEAKIIDAFVTNGTKKLKVDKKYIEYRNPLTSNTGLDSRKTLVIAFPEVKVGSVIEYKVSTKRHKALLQNHFEGAWSIGSAHRKPGKLLQIRSAIPLQHQVEGPKDYLHFKQGKTGKLYTYEVDLKREVFIRTTDESPHESWSPEPYRPTVRLSSFSSWAEATKIMARKMEKSYRLPLPPRFLTFIESAKTKRGFVDQANELMIQMIKEMRYMGDWRRAENFFFPRTYAEIDNTSFGDCKDFSLLLSTMLRSLGYKADVALIERGSTPLYPISLPGILYFNHMIVRAVDTSGKVHWLDPTNSAAYAGGKWPDISGRPVLHVAEGVDALESTPALEPRNYETEVEVEQLLGQGEWKQIKLLLTAKESFAAENLGSYRAQGKVKAQERFVRTVTESKPYRNEKVSIHTDDEYIPSIFKVEIQADVKSYPMQTTAGYAHFIAFPLQDYLDFDTSRMVLGAKINEIKHDRSLRVLKGIEFVGEMPGDCEVKSRWVDASFKYTKIPEGVQIEIVETVKRIYLTNEDLKSAEFEALRSEIRACTTPNILIYKPRLKL